MENIFNKINVKYPVIQGGMANIATWEFAKAVVEAGGLGTIGTGGWTPQRVEDEIKKMKEAVGDKSFAVNVMLMNPYSDEIIDLCLKYDVKVITTGAGNPGKYVEKVKANNSLIVPVVPSVALAKRMEKVGVDAVIVEGSESGGHVGEQTTMALVPQVVDAINIPVIAAGGIANNRQFTASICLGAQGVQIGTSLLATKECPIHENYKRLVLEAKDTSTVVTGRIKGVPVRALKTKMTREYKKLENTDISLEELELMTLGSLSKAVFDGDEIEGSFMAGQVAGQVKEIKTVKEVIQSIIDMSEVVKAVGEYYDEHIRN